jgi:DNA-directed RNA polymerase specialized sigma24 family protein
MNVFGNLNNSDLAKMRLAALNATLAVFHGQYWWRAEEIAEEVVGDAALKDAPIENPGGWGRVAGHRRALNWLRTRTRYLHFEDLENEPAFANGRCTPEAAQLEDIRFAFLAAVRVMDELLGELPSHEKDIFVNRNLNGMSDEQIAALSDRTPEAVRRHWFRIQTKLHGLFIVRLDHSGARERELLLEAMRNPAIFQAFVKTCKDPESFVALLQSETNRLR